MRELEKADPSKPISIANSSDPYTPPERRLGLTRKVLEVLSKKGFKVLIITKSDLVIRDLDIIRRGRFVVSMSITTLNDQIIRLIEPKAPPPSLRLKALGEIAANRVPCSIRLDPIIPTVNDRVEMIEEVIAKAAENGVSHITASTYKAKPDNFKRLISALPEDHRARLKELYIQKGQRIGKSIYLPEPLRVRLLAKVRNLAAKYGLTFATCRESLPQLNNAKSCDGTHLIPACSRNI